MMRQKNAPHIAEDRINSAIGRTFGHWARPFALGAAALMLVACSGIKKDHPATTEFQMSYDTMVKEMNDQEMEAGFHADELHAIPKSVADALLPTSRSSGAAKPVQELNDSEARFDVMVDNVPARDFFVGLVDGSDQNMVIHPLVSGNVSLTLNNVTVEEVVDTVCEIYGFYCQYEEIGFKIFPRRMTTRTFKVDFLPVIRKGRSQTTVSSGNSTDLTSTSSDGQSSTTSSVSGSNVETTNSSNFWTELQFSLESFLGIKGLQEKVEDKIANKVAEKAVEGRTPDSSTGVEGAGSSSQFEAVHTKSVMINKQAGLVVVRALPAELREVEDYLNALKQRNRYQVILEAKILEVELSDSFQYGVDWLAISKQIGNMPPLASEPSSVTGTITAGATFRGIQNTRKLVPAASGLAAEDSLPYTTNPAAIFGYGGTGNPFTFALRADDFISFIDLLEGQGKVQVLSSPRVSTSNNQKAVIKVGQDEIFITDVEVDVDENGNQIIDPKFVPFFSGVAMDVTPQIGEDRSVTLHIHPMVTQVTDNVKSFVFNGTNQSYPLALSQSREVDSIIQVKSGEVVVIGGLMQKQLNETENKIPVLGDIPIIGNAFKQVTKTWVRNELVILIRPVVVGQRKDWRNVLGKTAGRVRDMKAKEPMWWRFSDSGNR
ncbi:MAG: pilus (MSHA type) biogenesis protein MshL [Magnetococcales bacterium]|nr:pilus (MSHA type) biogenesis protein MshL [Magnetococcales bacterium]